ncbi:MAG: hypothetical protein HDR26_03625 [Lachnospiraceae bacterium]|nr:hypothetical protein [Lachnospiraceae bacterium]
MFIEKLFWQRRICFLTAVILGSVIWMWSGMSAQASEEIVITHVHTGSPEEGGGCYTRQNVHVHTGSSESGGGCYTVPVYHSHTGSAASGGGCYTVAMAHVHTGSSASGGGCYTMPVYHRHTGNGESGGGCYTRPVYHQHTGSSASGGGCYTAPVYHSHEGDSESGGGCYTRPVYHQHTGQEAAYANGCYTRKSEKTVITMCGTFVDDGDGFWHCNRCGVKTADWNVPIDRAHSPQSKQTVYILGCGKSGDIVESYLPECGKDGDTLEGYETECGMTTSTVVSYQQGCGKSEGTVESYVLQCSKVTDGYALGCGMTERTVEKYETGCEARVTYSLGCGRSAGETLGSLTLAEREGRLYVETSGITVKGYLWDDGSRGNMLSGIKPGTVYSCGVTYMDGNVRRSVELTAKTKETQKQQEETDDQDRITDSDTGSDVGGKDAENAEDQREIRGEGTMKELLSNAQTGHAQILKRGLDQKTEDSDTWMQTPENTGNATDMADGDVPETAEGSGSAREEGELTVGSSFGPASLVQNPGFPGKALAAACAVLAVPTVVLLLLFWSRCAILYCYDEKEHYQWLGILRASREKEGYRVRISGRRLERGTSGRYRIAVNRWLKERQEGSRFVVETERQKLNLVLEEYVDFAL